MNYKKFLFVFIIISIIYYILSNYVFINGGGGNATTPPSTSPPVDPFIKGVTSLTAAFSITSIPLPTNSPTPPGPSTSPTPSTQPSSSGLQITIDNTNTGTNKKLDSLCFGYDNDLVNYYVNVYNLNNTFYSQPDTEMNIYTKVNKTYENTNLVNTFIIPNGGYLLLSEIPSTNKEFNNKTTVKVKFSYKYLTTLISRNKNSTFNVCLQPTPYEFAGSLIDKTIPQ